MEFVRVESAQSSLNSAQAPDPSPPTQSAILHYTAELHATINRHHNSILQLLKLSATIEPLPDLSPRYDKLRDASFPTISGLATLITHLGSEEILCQEPEILTRQAKDDALELHTASMPPYASFGRVVRGCSKKLMSRVRTPHLAGLVQLLASQLVFCTQSTHVFPLCLPAATG
jgi:hypothetical protein